ncbi:MAG: hypothetical protein V3S55_14900 [Nitrospiraceae bacterium]
MTIVTDDRITGCQTALVFEGDQLHVRRNQDTTAIEEYNAAHRALIDQRARCAPDGEHVGRVPLEVMNDLIEKGIWYDDKALLEWLEQPENAAWKMHPGRFA